MERLYDVFDADGKIIAAGIKRNDIARVTGYDHAWIDERIYYLIPGLSTTIGSFKITMVRKAPQKDPNNSMVQLLRTGIWEETCRPFRILSERRKNGKH